MRVKQWPPSQAALHGAATNIRTLKQNATFEQGSFYSRAFDHIIQPTVCDGKVARRTRFKTTL